MNGVSATLVEPDFLARVRLKKFDELVSQCIDNLRERLLADEVAALECGAMIPIPHSETLGRSFGAVDYAIFGAASDINYGFSHGRDTVASLPRIESNKTFPNGTDLIIKKSQHALLGIQCLACRSASVSLIGMTCGLGHDGFACFFERHANDRRHAGWQLPRVASLKNRTQKLGLITCRPRQPAYLANNDFIGGMDPWPTAWKCHGKP
jgi:hypothetical protein